MNHVPNLIKNIGYRKNVHIWYVMKKYFLIFIFIFFLPLGSIYGANLETLKISVSNTSPSVGDTINVSILVDSTSQSMNAVSGTLIYTNNLSVSDIDKNNTIINFWTQDPTANSNKIKFEGVILNPGYKGSSGKIFSASFFVKKAGEVKIYLSDGAILANDGLGTNILDSLGSVNISISPKNGKIAEISDINDRGIVALPVITEYSDSVITGESVFLKGLGEPNALTKIVFKDVSFKSIGERFVEFAQTKKRKLDDVLIKNESDGTFSYITSDKLLAGVYNATPFLVDEDTSAERAGFGVQLLISDNKIVKNLVVFINILALFIPIVGLVVIIYFIPWYSFKRMRVLRKKLGFEEEKIELAEHRLKKQDDML